MNIVEVSNCNSVNCADVKGKRVLLAIDSSPASRNVLNYMLESSWTRDCSLKLVTLIEPLVSKYQDGYSAIYSKTLFLEESEAVAKSCSLITQVVSELQKRFSFHRVQTIVAAGDPAECILQLAEDWADLIVMGSRKRNMIEQFWRGSVSQEVTKKADCAVRVIVADPVQDARLQKLIKANLSDEDPPSARKQLVTASGIKSETSHRKNNDLK